VQLTVDGAKSTQPLRVAMDPRVKTPAEELRLQYVLSREIYNELNVLDAATKLLRSLRASAKGDADFDKRTAALLGEPADDFAPPRAAPRQPESLNSVAGSLRTLLAIAQSADAMPNATAVAAVQEKHAAFLDVIKRFDELKQGR